MKLDCLGMTYNAEPIFEDVVPGNSVLLELHVILFESSYYKSDQGERHTIVFIHRLIEVQAGRS